MGFSYTGAKAVSERGTRHLVEANSTLLKVVHPPDAMKIYIGGSIA